MSRSDAAISSTELRLPSGVALPAERVAAFCEKWGVRELSLFGSVLREDFGEGSDVDVLVALAPGVSMTFEGFLAMRDELSKLFGGRDVDLVERRLVTNPFRRHDILTTRRVVYAA
jgi:predicted nucleotidyltransferase